MIHAEKAIYKYPLLLQQHQTVMMHHGARILTAQMQDSSVCLWAEVDIKAPATAVEIKIYGTGFQIGDNVEYINTVQDESFVWHIYRERQND